MCDGLLLKGEGGEDDGRVILRLWESIGLFNVVEGAKEEVTTSSGPGEDEERVITRVWEFVLACC